MIVENSMSVEQLISKLSELPKDAKIGMSYFSHYIDETVLDSVEDVSEVKYPFDTEIKIFRIVEY